MPIDELVDPLEKRRRKTHDQATAADLGYVKTITVADYTNLVDATSTITLLTQDYTFVSASPGANQILISAVSNDDQASLISAVLQDLVDSDESLFSISVSTNVITIRGLNDFTLSTNQTDALTIATAETFAIGPTGTQVFNFSNKHTAALAATALINVFIETDGVFDGTADIQFWVYDKLLAAWCRGRKDSLPPTDEDNSTPFALKFDHAGQTWGITVAALGGTNPKLTMTGVSVARITGGN